MNNSTTTALREQFSRCWAMWRVEIENISDEQWQSGDIDYLIPVRHACHIAETADFYTGDIAVDRFSWGTAYGGGDWEGTAASALPDRLATLALLEQMSILVDARLAAISETQLHTPSIFPWTGATLLDALLYLLRHTQHHLGEMHAELRRRNIPRAEWK